MVLEHQLKARVQSTNRKQKELNCLSLLKLQGPAPVTSFSKATPFNQLPQMVTSYNPSIQVPETYGGHSHPSLHIPPLQPSGLMATTRSVYLKGLP